MKGTKLATFAVVTNTKPEGMPEGNLASMLGDLYLPKGGTQGQPYVRAIEDPQFQGLAFHARYPVFHVGEILILDESGREFGYPGRKPSKWFIETEEFDDLDDAIRRSLTAQEQDLAHIQENEA